jgi:hypothetical protein
MGALSGAEPCNGLAAARTLAIGGVQPHVGGQALSEPTEHGTLSEPGVEWLLERFGFGYPGAPLEPTESSLPGQSELPGPLFEAFVPHAGLMPGS